jgi:deazaflavin-dependent oxidoreductase (nitroreductase family)
MNATAPRYIQPSSTDIIFNNIVGRLTRMGISVYGSRVLYVRGRTSGEWRTTPVNPVRLPDGTRYIVAPRGTTQWVKNLRAAGGGELRIGGRTERFTATEVADADKPAVLRPYLRKWAWEVGQFFNGVNAKAPEEKLLEIAPDYPIFRIELAK